MPDSLFVGLISGTSVDAVDAVLVDLGASPPRLVHQLSYAWDPALARQLRRLATAPRLNLSEFGQLDQRIAEVFANATMQLLRDAGIAAADVRAIGSHGQTIYHAPDVEHPFTLQIGDPSRIAALTGIDTVADFRRKDMALGGQGAPLAPAFHATYLASETEDVAVLNLGGIANLTLLPANGESATGMDTGPANTLLDAWVREHWNQGYDRNGGVAAVNEPDPHLLQALLDDVYFTQTGPKSTGPERFNLGWVRYAYPTVDQLQHGTVLRTLLELTVHTVTRTLKSSLPGSKRLLVCGGGVHNGTMMRRLAQELPGTEVISTAEAGVDPDWMEAIAFAWLARQCLDEQPGNLPSVTGASRATILGGIYRAR